MHRIGILSDTHGLLRPEVKKALDGCEAILHAGDINRQEIIDQLSVIAPVYVVRGNNDKEWAEHIPFFLDFTLCGLHIYMTHKKKDLPRDVSNYDLVVYGHSHRYEQGEVGGTVLINPGSCGPRRFHQDITLALADIEAQTHQIAIHRIDIPHKTKRQDGGHDSLSSKKITLETISQPDIDKVIRLIKKKKGVDEIAAQMGMERGFAEQICRLYLTHPGVTAEGIMTKMGL
jgi:putative phosphoesterase